MASLYIAFNYIRRHLPKFLLICFCCSILISSAVMIPINSSISNFGGFLQANSSKSNYSRLFFNTGEDVDYSSLAERYCGLIGITGYTNLQNHEYCIGYADEIARDSLSVKLINGKLPENKNEIAVTDSMLEILNVNIGDTVTLDMTSESPGQREFVITGTVNDYYSLFTNGEHQLVAGDNSGFARAFPRILCGKQNDYLQKNIVSNAVCNYYAELDENYNIPFFSSDGFSVNNEQSVRFYNSYYSSNADTVFSYISAVAIIVGIFFGVYICVSLLINSEKSNNEILRNIGATGILVKRVLLWQGLFISVIASVVSVGLVFAVTELINMITVKNSLFRFNLSGNLFAILSLSAFVSVMLFFAYHILFKSSKNKIKVIKISNIEKVSFFSLWSRTVSKNAVTSKAAYSIVLASLMILVTGGSFLADQHTIGYVENTDMNNRNYDYVYFIGGGYMNRDYFSYSYPSYNGFIVFDVAADMVRMCPALSKRVKILASQKRLIYTPTNSFYQVLSAEAYSKHGFNIHGVVFDELHTQPNRKLFDVMTKGSGDARMQPLYFLITTAGTDTHSICYETHQKAKDIIEGRKIDPTFYPVIYGADESDDWTDPKVWKKANPSLDITVGIDKVKAACESAKQNPGEENAFRQLRLNQWVKQAVRWMPMEKWDNCAFAVDEDELEGRVCYGGLDLSSTTDITAFVLAFPPLDDEDKYIILPYFWIPEDNLTLRVNRDHVPYDVWERQGYLQTTEGNVVHYGFIEKFIEKLGERFNIREIAFDRWGAVQMVQNLEGMGFTVVPFGQGFKDMSPPTKELMKLVLEQKIAHGGHPVLRWNMDNIYIRTDPAGNIKADKEKSTEKIDGAVATIMALDRAIRCGNDHGASVYDDRGILFI